MGSGLLDVFRAYGAPVSATGLFLLAIGLLIRTWPAIMARITEGKRADSEIAKELRDELLDRLKECEESHRKTADAYDALLTVRQHDQRKIWALQDVLSFVLVKLMQLAPEGDDVLRAKTLLEVALNTPPPDAAMEDALRRLNMNEDGSPAGLRPGIAP
jgi:hypothetical protein